MSTTIDRRQSLVERLFPCGFRSYAWTLSKMGISFGISYILSQWMINGVSLIFMSHQGEAIFNACTLANTLFTLLGYTLLLGCNCGCDTLLPQYYGGNKQMMSVILQRGALISIYPCTIVCITMLNIKYVLQWIEHDENVVRLTSIYMQCFIFAVPFISLSGLLRMYIGTTGTMLPIICTCIVANIVNAVAHYVCLYQFNMGIRAAPISITIAYMFVVLCYIVYIRFSSLYTETWQPITRTCLQDWNIYLKYAIPGTIVLIIDFWSVETSTLFAAYIGNQSLSAQSVAQQVLVLACFTILGLSDASNIIIGQNIGANKPIEARNTKNVTYVISAVLALINSALIFALHQYIPYLFSIDGSTLLLAQHLLLLIGVVVIFDAFHLIQSGMIKACGMQKFTTICFAIGFGLIGFPIVFLTTFKLNMDVFGFWIGMIAAEMFTTTVLFILLYRVKWSVCSEEAINRIAKDSIEPNVKVLSKTDSDDECQELLSDSEPSVQINQSTNSIDFDHLQANSAPKSLFKSTIIQLTILFALLCLLAISAAFSYQ